MPSVLDGRKQYRSKRPTHKEPFGRPFNWLFSRTAGLEVAPLTKPESSCIAISNLSGLKDCYSGFIVFFFQYSVANFLLL